MRKLQRHYEVEPDLEVLRGTMKHIKLFLSLSKFFYLNNPFILRFKFSTNFSFLQFFPSKSAHQITIKMFTKALIVLSAFLALSSGFNIPQDGVDGAIYVYDHDLDSHTIISYPDDTPATTGHSAKFRREKKGDPLPAESLHNCGTNAVTALDLGNAQIAAEGLCSSAVKNKIKGRKSLWVSSGDATVYLCNYGGDNTCSGSEMHDAIERTKRYCASDDKTGFYAGKLGLMLLRA